MNATQQLHDLGQSLWLDNITRGLLTSGTLERMKALAGQSGAQLEVSPLLADDTEGTVRAALQLHARAHRPNLFAAAEAYMRGIERRLATGLEPRVRSVASIFVSRWDVAVREKVSSHLRNRLGIAIGKRTYKAYRDAFASPRWRKLAASGALPQRLLWASTGTKDPAARDVHYVEALAKAREA